jgi:hypothetical protein
MPTKLDQFYSSAWTTGIARPNRFEVIINFPSLGGITELNSQTLSRHLSFVCEQVEIPSQTIATAESRINGLPVIPIPYSFSYTNQLNLSFKLSENFIERKMLLLWQSLIYNPGSGFNYYNNYIGTILVRPMNAANVVKQEFLFRNCFPITIQDLQLNWGSNNESLKQGATFSFFSAEVRDTVSSSNSQSGNPLLISGHEGEVDPTRQMMNTITQPRSFTV